MTRHHPIWLLRAALRVGLRASDTLPMKGRESCFYFFLNAAIASTVWRTLASMPAQSFA